MLNSGIIPARESRAVRHTFAPCVQSRRPIIIFMPDIVQRNIVQVIFGLVAFTMSCIAIYYARKNFLVRQQGVIDDAQRSVRIYLSREAMISALYAMYDNAEAGDVIWAQAVSMRNYPGNVREKILTAAGKNVTFKMILNNRSPAFNEFKTLFDPVKQAQVVETGDSQIRVQGLSTKEVIVAFPTMTAYTAIRFTDKAFVAIIKNWFDLRFDQLSKPRATAQS
jgi:hypothetical protein